jgi:SAM-dependent methyltransferase
MAKSDLRPTLGSQNVVVQRYLSEEYIEHNPSWDLEDSPWKADLVRQILKRQGWQPGSIVEVGCGAGGVLAALRESFPKAQMHGFDIAPAAAQLWSKHSTSGISFTLGDFLSNGEESYDLVLLLDVVEHLANPFEFLARVRPRGRRFVFHFPLDLSALNVLRESPLLHARAKVGHLHYFTKSLALELLDECGYEVLDARFTGAALNAPQRSWKSRLMGILRHIAYALHHDVAVRLLGGETLIVLARPRDLT